MSADEFAEMETHRDFNLAAFANEQDADFYPWETDDQDEADE